MASDCPKGEQAAWEVMESHPWRYIKGCLCDLTAFDLSIVSGFWLVIEALGGLGLFQMPKMPFLHHPRKTLSPKIKKKGPTSSGSDLMLQELI